MSFETRKTKKSLRKRALENYPYWRLIFDGGMDYNSVFYQMTPDEITEANLALDHYIDLIKAAGETKRK